MSSFSGVMPSLPGVRCDRFDKLERERKGVKADQFFLSHTHSDHMKGIEELGRHLKRKGNGPKINNKLYCSQIAKAFVLSRTNIPDKAIVVLEANVPKIVTVYDSKEMYYVRVTAIGANHCPGSVMFLFERLHSSDGEVAKRILYTGDFRFEVSEISVNPLPLLRSLHDPNGDPLVIDELYLDTTFCTEMYQSFPSRLDAEKKIWDQCEKWIKKNGLHKNTRNKHMILLNLPARYGYERILETIYTNSAGRWKIHVNPDKAEEYMCNADLARCGVTSSPELGQWIHACYYKSKSKTTRRLLKTLPCTPGEFEVCQIKPCAMFFTTEKQASLKRSTPDGDNLMSLAAGDSYRICYSTHSSMNEIRDFVRYFNPKKMIPCVIPPFSSQEKVGALLQSFLDPVAESPVSSSSLPMLPFSPLKGKKRESSEPDSLDFLALTPEKKQKLESPEKRAEEISDERVGFDPYMNVDEGLTCLNDSSEEEVEPETGDETFDPTKSRGWNSIEVIPGIIKQELPDLKRRHASLTITPTSPPACIIVPSTLAKLPTRLPEPQSSEGTSTSSGNNADSLAMVGIKEDKVDGGSYVKRRQTFARSKTDKTYYSMPVCQEFEMDVPKERRFSMPSNMKLPLIKVTPSSPSPDPDDPDYPEFFQDRIYLEHVSLKLKGSVAAVPSASTFAAADASVASEGVAAAVSNLSQSEQNQTKDDDTGSLDGGGGGGSGDLNLTLEDSSSNDVILSPPSSSIGVNSDAVTILPIAVDGVEVSSRQLPAPVSPMAPAGFDVTSQLTSSILSRVAPKRFKRQQSMFKSSLEDEEIIKEQGEHEIGELDDSARNLNESSKSAKKRKSTNIFAFSVAAKSAKVYSSGLDETLKIDPKVILDKIETTTRSKILVHDSDDEDDTNASDTMAGRAGDNITQNAEDTLVIPDTQELTNDDEETKDDSDEDNVGIIQYSQALLSDDEEVDGDINYIDNSFKPAIERIEDPKDLEKQNNEIKSQTKLIRCTQTLTNSDYYNDNDDLEEDQNEKKVTKNLSDQCDDIVYDTQTLTDEDNDAKDMEMVQDENSEENVTFAQVNDGKGKANENSQHEKKRQTIEHDTQAFFVDEKEESARNSQHKEGKGNKDNLTNLNDADINSVKDSQIKLNSYEDELKESANHDNPSSAEMPGRQRRRRRRRHSSMKSIEELLQEAIDNNHEPHIIQNLRAQVEIHRNPVQID